MRKTLINSIVIKTVILCTVLMSHRHLACVAGEKVITDSSPTQPIARFDTSTEEMSDAFAKVAKTVKPSLVRIQPCYGDTDKDLPSAIPLKLDGETSSSIQSPGSVSVPDKRESENPKSRHGSGVVVSEDGYLWTSSDVVRDARSANVTLSTGEELSGRILFVDQDSGLAILKIDAKGLVPLKLADNPEPRVAEWAMAVSPASDDHPALSRGIIWLNEHTASSRGTRDFFSYDPSGAAIEPGSALVNLQGQLVGIDVSPSLHFRDASGKRYGLSSDSALALQNAISDEALSVADQSTSENLDVSTGNTPTATDASKNAQDQRRNRGSNRNKMTEFTQRENRKDRLSTKRIGATSEEWLGWIKERLSAASPEGGIISK